MAKAIVNFLSPLSKASLLGIVFDLLPYFKVSWLKTLYQLNQSDLQRFLVKAHKKLGDGSLVRGLLKEYPKKDSWLTSLLVSVILFKLWSPSFDKYPPPIEDDEEQILLTKHGISNTLLDLTSGSRKSTHNKFFKNRLSRLEVETIVKQTITSTLSVSACLWLLHSKKSEEKFIFKSSNKLFFSIFALVQAGHSLWNFQRLRTKTLGGKWQLTTPWMNCSLNFIGSLSEVLVFSWSSYRILLDWVFNNEHLPEFVKINISRFIEMEKPLRTYIRAINNHSIIEGTHSDILASYCHSLGLNSIVGDPFYGIPSCQLFHPLDGEVCSQHLLRKFIRTFFRAFLTLYVPCNIVIFLIGKKNNHDQAEDRKSLYTKIKEKVFYPSIRSSIFLGSFVSCFFGIFCFSRQKLKSDQHSIVLSSALCGVTSIMIESPVLRLYMALLLFPRALTSFYYTSYRNYIPPRYLENPLFILSLSTILTCYRLQPDSIQPILRNFLHWVFKKY